MTLTIDKLKKKPLSLAELATKLGVSEKAILSHRRHAALVDARSIIVAYLSEHMHARQQDIALLLAISQAAVSKLYSRHRALVQVDDGYRDCFKTFLQSFEEIEN